MNPTVANTKTRLIIQVPKSYGRIKIDSFSFTENKCIVVLAPEPDFGIIGSSVKQGGWKYETMNVPGRSRKTKFGNTKVTIEELPNGHIRLMTYEPLKPLIVRDKRSKSHSKSIEAPPVAVPSTVKEELLSLRDCINRVNALKAEIGDDLVLSIVDGKLKALVEY